MSDKEPPRDGGGGGAGGEPTEKIDQRERKCDSCGKKGKKVSLFRFGKGKKLFQQRRKHRDRGSSVNSGCCAKCGGGAGRGGCGGGGFLCFKQPRAMDSSGESPTSDCNSGAFNCDMLTALIEKNDFYSKECNPHLDRDGKV
ncbi:unnamed protein product [Fraxinus pennsylvanica]|uniref:Uncharacterized protein n=1 Tax=Fraxinus pennsylvanica TaxID=56036 RepID=A0AAD1ZI35_9LAMI|nr:unnamed protein product [Fraxinus pennsylvanica]